MTKHVVLELDRVTTRFRTDQGVVTALDEVSLAVPRGQTLGLVGESGSGKSVTSLSIMGLLPQDIGYVASGRIFLDGQDISKLSQAEYRKLRGRKMAMIFQEPMTALNPVMTVGDQVAEVFQIHKQMNRRESLAAALAMFQKVKIPDAERRLGEYPHQLSGGMKQRVMIALALACEPALIIADEPTTALDVTIQAQILRLMKDLQRDLGTSILFITHDLGVIAEIADHVAVMYAGRIVEMADVFTLFASPKHPYTQGLIATLKARFSEKNKKLPTIPGTVPSLRLLPNGCHFQERCGFVMDRCRGDVPALVPVSTKADSPHHVRCFLTDKSGGKS